MIWQMARQSVRVISEDESRQFAIEKDLNYADIAEQETFVAWILIHDEPLAEEKIRNIIARVSTFDRSLMICRRGQDLLFLPHGIKEDEQGKAADAFAGLIHDAGDETGVLCMFGGCDAFGDIFLSYRLAKRNAGAARIIFPERKWHTSSQLRFSDQIVQLSGDVRYVRYAIEELAKLDDIYMSGEPTRFLSTYFLDCGMDMNVTAEKMFLHKNTLKYRKNKINSLLGYDIGKVENDYSLINMLALNRYFEGMRRKENS